MVSVVWIVGGVGVAVVAASRGLAIVSGPAWVVFYTIRVEVGELQGSTHGL